MQKSNYNFESFIPLITRWINNSHLNSANVVRQVSNFFSKAFYIFSAERLGITYNYENIFSESLLNHYGIKLTDLPNFDGFLLFQLIPALNGITFKETDFLEHYHAKYI